jgi:AraC family transcriptional regulator of adaptative response / DNA-3-methyladenine glycosylase II
VPAIALPHAPPADPAVDPDDAGRYAALVAHDARFDGCFYVGVTSTGVYCRPVCRVRTPRAANCRFYPHAAAAEAAGFRPCLRCRPERAPGLAPIDAGAQLAWAAARRIEAGALDHAGLPELAERLGITDRHLRRLFHATFGVTPVAYAQTQRLLLAKRLLADTHLPLTEVALAAGFGSLRRFNTLFQQRYRLTPGELRRRSGTAAQTSDGAAPLQFELSWRPPFDAAGWLAGLAAHALPGVEQVDALAGRYRRTITLTGHDGRRHAGWIALRPQPERHAVALTLDVALLPVLAALLAGVRRLCDLDCDPQAVARQLGPLAAAAPGLRLLGAIDPFEAAVRAVLDLHHPAATAHTLAARLVQTCGTPLPSPWPALTQLFPDAAALAALAPQALTAIGCGPRCAATVIALAQAVARGQLELPTADIAVTLAQLQALPGLDAAAAQHIALHALGWPDAWPADDSALRQALGRHLGLDQPLDAPEAETLSQAWRPWRSYAALHLWRGAQAAADALTSPAQE